MEKEIKSDGCILVYDSNKGLLTALCLQVKKLFKKVIPVQEADEIIPILKREEVNIVMMDIGAQANGAGKKEIAIVKEIVELQRDIQVITLANFSQTALGVESVEAGAYYFLSKPWHNDKLRIVLKNAYNFQKLSRVQTLQEHIPGGGCCNMDVNDAFNLTLEQMEMVMINAALKRTRGNISLAAEQLGITRQTLYNKGKKHKLLK